MYFDRNIDELINDNLRLLYYLKNIGFTEEREEEIVKECTQAIKKLSVCKMLYGTQVIAISGEQGAGKSTLIKNMYNIPDGILSIREGRGEKIPVLIKEHDRDEYVFYSYNITLINEIYGISKDEILENEFAEISENPPANTIFMELIVPRKFFSEKVDTAFLLMPGFEEKNSYWQSIIDFSIACSDFCILAYHSTMLSGRKIEEIKERVLNNQIVNKPIYAITNSERLSEEQKNEIIDNSKKIFIVDENETDRFVFTGVWGEEKNQIWIDQLIESCKKYISTPGEAQNQQNDYISTIIQKDLKELYRKTKYYLSVLQTDEIDSLEMHPLLRAFDEENRRQKKRFKDNLKGKLRIADKKSRDRLDDYYSSKEERSLKGFIEFVGKFVFGDAPKDIIEMEHLIQSVMTEDNGDSMVATAFKESLETLSQDVSSIVDSMIQKNDDLLPGEEAHGTDNVELVKNALMIIKEDGELVEDKLMLKNIAKTIHLIAVYAYASQMENVLNANVDKINYIESTAAQLTIQMEDCIEAKKKSQSTFMGLMTMFGIDYLPDHEMNLLEQLSETFGVSLSCMQTVFGVVSLGYFASSVGKTINRHEKQRFLALRNEIDSQYNNALSVCSSQYEEYMDNIREKVIAYIVKSKNIGKKDTLIMNTTTLISRMEDNLFEIQDQIRESDAILGIYQ